MGFLDSVFGGGGTTDIEIEKASLLGNRQKRTLGGLAKFVNPQIGQGAEVFGGQRVADTSGLQQSAFDIFGGLSPEIGQAISGGLGGLAQSSSALQGFLGDFDPSQSQQDFQTQVANPALLNFQQNILPSTANRFSNSANTSGTFQQALANNATNLQSNLLAQGSAFNQNSRNTFNSNKLNAANQLTGQSQLGLGFGNTLAGLGGQQRGIAQEGLNADFSRFSEGQAVNNPILQLLPLLLGTRGFENIVSGGQAQGGGAGGALGNLAGSFLGTESGSDFAVDAAKKFAASQAGAALIGLI